MSKKTQLC